MKLPCPNYKKNIHITKEHAAAATAAKLHQSCLNLCDPIDGSPPGSPSSLATTNYFYVWDCFCFVEMCTLTFFLWNVYFSNPVTPLCYLTINHSGNCAWVEYLPCNCPPHLAFKNIFLKASEEFGVVGGMNPQFSLHNPLKTFFSSRLHHFGLFGLTVHWAHEFAFGNSSRLMSFYECETDTLREEITCLKSHHWL